MIAWLREYAATRLGSQLADARRSLPPYVVMDLGNRGVLGLVASKAYGGMELSAREYVAVFEQLGAIDLTLAVFVGIHNGLGIRPIERFGSDAAKRDLLPQLASGRILGAFAMTEPAAGSNARNIEAQAIADGAGWRLRGRKIWVGNGSWAGAINVVARRPPSEGGGTCAFTVRPGMRGLRMGPEAMTTGMRAIVQNEVILDDVAVTRDELLGTAGDGFDVANDMFAIARFGISAIALGGLRRCIQLAHRFASRREVNSGPLLANARTRDVLASMVASATACEALLQHVAARCDGIAPPPDLAAICKVVVPELLGRVADQATQLLGGRGYIESNVLPQIVRDARLLRIFEGPTETLEMHLGSAVLGNKLAPPNGIDEHVRRFTADVEGTSGDARVVAMQRAKLAVGQIAAWGTLADVTAQLGDDPLAQLAKRWAAAELASRAHALASPLVADRAIVERAIADLRDAIGDVHQTLPGEDHVIDPLLVP